MNPNDPNIHHSKRTVTTADINIAHSRNAISCLKNSSTGVFPEIEKLNKELIENHERAIAAWEHIKAGAEQFLSEHLGADAGSLRGNVHHDQFNGNITIGLRD